MGYYDGVVRCSNGKYETIRIYANKELSNLELEIISYMTYEQAARYCRYILKMPISRRYPEEE